MARLFVAIVPPDDVKDAAAAFPASEPGVRLARREQLHVTLRFAGEFPDERIASLKERLRRIEHPAFTLTVGPWGRFGYRTAWLGVAPEAPVVALADAVDAAFRAEGTPRRELPFRPHLTVARLTKLSPVKARQLLESAPPLPELRWDVGAFVLVQSTLSPDGATHTPLLEVPLR